jgi:hypothetical protein
MRQATREGTRPMSASGYHFISASPLPHSLACPGMLTRETGWPIVCRRVASPSSVLTAGSTTTRYKR